MKIYTCNKFEGHWPVGSAAVIVATDRDQAKFLLEKALEECRLPQRIKKRHLKELNTDISGVTILCDGNY